MNRIQRVSIWLLFAVSILLISMHNPMSGYVYEGNSYKVDVPLVPCSEQDKKAFRQSLTNLYQDVATRERLIIPNGDPNQIEKAITRQVAECHLLAPGIHTARAVTQDYRKQQLEFSEWRTVDPLIDWLGKVVNLLGALSAVVLIGGSFVLFVFPKKA